MVEKARTRVAIVGSGMAGLVTAYLLNNDKRSRFEVTVFEQGNELSLDSASITIPAKLGDGVCERIDVPMRAFAGGFYQNLKAMYDFLGIQYHAQPFLFAFSESKGGSKTTSALPEQPYFIHPSNLHRLPPTRPPGVGILRHFVEMFYLLFWYTWFTACCFFSPPSDHASGGLPETVEQYMARIRLPRHFLGRYLLPLICSVSTCPRDQLLKFPASDVVGYKRKTHGAHHYTVSNGVQDVEHLISKDVDVRFNARVMSVETDGDRNTVSWRYINSKGRVEGATEQFDQVVLAVTPDVVGEIFEPLCKAMSHVPTMKVEVAVHVPTTTGKEDLKKSLQRLGLDGLRKGAPQVISIRTDLVSGNTEAAHFQPSGVVVTTCPLTPPANHKVISESSFTRVLRTPKSRVVVNQVLGLGAVGKEDKQWRNGDDNVWLVGGWCWDGMVLLEGCIVSAMRVADAFGVDIPWRKE